MEGLGSNLDSCSYTVAVLLDVESSLVLSLALSAYCILEVTTMPSRS